MNDPRNKPEVLVFDVNETLLGLAAIQPEFKRIFGTESAIKDWFALLLQYSLVTTIANSYSDFGVLGRATLQMLAQSRNVPLSKEDEEAVLQGMKALPAHPDVRPALERLRKARFRLATLTNSSPSMIDAQLRNSGLKDYFEQAISVEEVRLFKPHRAVYDFAASRLQVSPSKACLVAAHAWDVFGAMNAGWTTAFVARPGKVLFPLSSRPSFVAENVDNLATTIIERYRD